MIGKWKGQFLSVATQAFETDANSAAEQDRIAELEYMVSKLTMELEIGEWGL